MSVLDDEIKRVEGKLAELEGHPGAEGLVSGLKGYLERMKSVAGPQSVAEQRAEAGVPVDRSAAPRQTTDAPTKPEAKAADSSATPRSKTESKG